MTLDVMIHHTAAVVRGTEKALVIADMPFLTYQITPSEAVRNAGRLLKDAGAAAVKVEGGRSAIDVVRRLVDVGIPVMGHLGVLPQSVNQQSGYRQRGHDPHEAEMISTTRSRCRTPARSRSCSRRYPPSSRRKSRRRSKCRQSASARARNATARCSSARTCWDSTTGSRRSSRSTRSFGGDCNAARVVPSRDDVR